MPIYTTSYGKRYNIPSDIAAQFEKDFPDAQIRYEASGEEYDIPLKKRDSFLKAYPNAKTVDRISTPPKQDTQPEYRGPGGYFAPKPRHEPNPSALIAEEVERQQRQAGINPNSAEAISQRFDAMVEALPSRKTKEYDDQLLLEDDRRREEQYNKTHRLGMMQAQNAEWGRPYSQRYGRTEDNTPILPLADAGNQESAFSTNLHPQDYPAPSPEAQQVWERRTNEARAQSQFESGVRKQLWEVSKVVEEQDRKKDEEIRQWREQSHKRALEGKGALPIGPTPPEEARRYSNLKTARGLLDEAVKVIEQADQNTHQGTSGIGNALRGIKNNLFDPIAWERHVGTLADASNISKVIAKSDRNETLTDDEQSLLDALATNMAVNSLYGSKVGMGYNIGKSIAQSLPFMIEFALNPIAGSSKTIAGKIARYWLKHNAKGKVLKKAGARVIGDIAAATGTMATSGSLRTAADAITRMTGNPLYEITPEGKAVYAGHEQGDTPLKAIGKSATAGSIEYYTELLGGAFGPIGRAVGGVLGKVPGMKSITGYLSRSQAAELIRGIRTSDWAKSVGDFTSRTGWHGMLEEYSEEEIGNILNYFTVGDVQKKDLLDPQQHLETFGSVALMGGFFSALKTAGYRPARSRAQKQVAIFDQQAGELLGEEWQNIKAACDNNTDPQSGTAALAQVLESSQYNPEQKRAILSYFAAKQSYNGVLLADQKSSEEQTKSPEQTAIENSYDAGYKSVDGDPSAKQAIKQHLNQVSAPFSEERLQELRAVKNPMQYISEHPQEAPQLLEWFKANSTYTGMIEAVQDQIQQKIKESDDAVDSRTHTDGNLYTVTLKGDNAAQGYITQGDVAFNPDGSVNKTKSNDRVTVRYADGHSEMLSIDDLGRLVETNNAQELKAQNADAIWEEESRRAAAEIDGTTGPSQGDPITLKDGRRGIFYADTGDGNYLVQLEDGSVIPAPQTAVTLLNRQPSQQEQQPTPQPAQTTPQQAAPQSAPTSTAKQTMTPSPAQEPQNGVDNRIGRSLNKEEADNLIAEMENRAEPAPELELTPENWTAEFGEDGMVDTPIGKVKMGENQLAKMFLKGRNNQLGMVKPTLTSPDIVIEIQSPTTNAQHERNTSLLFVKTFIGKDGKKHHYFTSVTVQKDGMEVSISNHIETAKRIRGFLEKGKLLYRVYGGAQTEHSRANTSGTTSPTNPGVISFNKDTQNIEYNQTNDSDDRIGRSLNKEEADNLIAEMENRAEPAPELELTPENWTAEFGKDGMVDTPIGKVKMGENQYQKLVRNKRENYFGMIKPTLESPDIVVEKVAPADNAERDTKLIFVKTFTKPDGSRVVHFQSVTVKKDGLEVSISSHEAEPKDIKKDMQNATILHISEKMSHGSEGSLTEAPVAEGPDLVPTSDNLSTNEDTTPFAENQIPADQNNTNTSSEATQTPTEVTYPRDEKTGHILFDQIDDPTVVAAALRNEFGEQALEAAQTKLQDLQGELEKAASTKDTFERLYKQRDLQREIAKYQQVVSTLTPTEVEQITPQEMNRAEVQPENVQNETNRSEQQGQETTNADTQTVGQEESVQNLTPIAEGPFGPVYDQFRGNPSGAIAYLSSIRTGEAVGALHHPQVGDISLVWGNSRSGLEKIMQKHPEVLEDMQGILDNMQIVQESDNRVKLESPSHFAVISKEYKGSPREGWLLTTYEKKNSVLDNRMDTDETLTGGKNDTATPTNTVSSTNEDTTNIQEDQESTSKNTENQTNPPTHKVNTPILPRKQTAPKYAKEIAQFGDEVSIEDVVLRDIALGQKFSWEDHGKSRGIASELGFSGKEAERRSRISMLRNDGITVDDYVHGLWQEYGERFRQDDAQIRDAVLDVLQRVYSPKAAMEQLRNLHAQEEFSQEEQNILTPEEQDAFGNAPVSEYAFREPEATTPEEQQIIDQAKQNGTYLKAPNGKPTNLTAAQWVKVRTQAFKNWFGDWEKIAKLANSKHKGNERNRSKQAPEYTDDFRRVQASSRKLSQDDISAFHRDKQDLNESDRELLSGVFRRQLISASSRGRYAQRTLIDPKQNIPVQILEDVDRQLFHDIFEIVRNYLKNGELVDLHENYDNATCYLAADGLSGFAVEDNGNLVSVFNLNPKIKFLRTIKDYVTECGATHLDGYNSPKQPLAEIYQHTLGWQVASLMDYNMEFDHDDIAANHDAPQVAFMVNSSQDVETKSFNKDSYDEAEAYQQEQVKAIFENCSKVIDENGEPLAVYPVPSSTNTTDEGAGNDQQTGLYFETGGNGTGDRSRQAYFLNIRDPKHSSTQGDLSNTSHDGAILQSQQPGETPSATKPEEQQIIDQAKQNGTYMKAPNGKPTNLTAAQWVKVRTQAFKNWFGDWEKTARIEKLRKSKPVEITGEEYKEKYELNRNSAKQWIKDNLRGNYTIEDTGEIVQIGRKGVNKVTSHSMGNEAHLKSLIAIPQMLNHAIFIAEEQANKQHAQYPRYRYYVVGLKIGRIDYTAKLTIGVDQSGNKYYDHALTEIEKGKLLEELDRITSPSSQQAVIPGFISTGDVPVPSVTKSQDTKLLSLLQTNSSKNVDKNGEPLVSEVNAFEKDSIHFRQDDRTLQAVNDQFNAELQQQIEGTLPQGHIYQLGHPNEALQAAGIPNLPIELAASRLETKASKDYSSNHPFDLKNIQNLPQAISSPIAVFDSKTQPNSKVIFIELQQDGVNFVVAVKVHSQRANYQRKININSIRSVYPKDYTRDIINWINRGDLLRWADKEKILNWLTQQQSNSADVDTPIKDISVATNIVNSFENPTLTDGKKVATAEELSETLHTPIRIVRNVNDIHDDEKEAFRKRRACGWYDMETGEVVIVLPNCRDEAEVQATILHEVVGHKGLRELVGEENYNDLLRRVWSSLDPATKAKKQKQYGHPLIAADEYLASLAEENVEPNVLKRILAQVRSWLREVLGMDIKLSDNDIRYLLWRSKHNLQNKQNIFERAETAAKDAELRYRLGINNRTQDQSANTDDATQNDVNQRFNEQLERWLHGNMSTNEYLVAGKPNGTLKQFMPDLPIILRQKVLSKGRKKHELSADHLRNLPSALANPIFVFKNAYNKVGILTELKDSKGKNIFVAIALGVSKQMGHNMLEINDMLTLHGREVENIINPIAENGKLVWANKKKGLNWLSSAKSNSQAIANQTLLSATNIIKNFENPTLPSEENIRFRENGNNLDEVNRRFNEQLDAFEKGQMRSNDWFNMGTPGAILQSAGLPNKPITMTQSVLRKHMAKHGFSATTLRNIPDALNTPLMVYEWGDKARSLIVITEIPHGDHKITAAIKLNRNGKQLEVNEIASVHGKSVERLVKEIIHPTKDDFAQDLLRYVDKKKALNWMSAMEAPLASSQTSSQELSLATNIIKNFENPPLPSEENIRFRENGNELDAVNRRFNEQLDAFEKGQMRSNDWFNMGTPGAILQSAGLPNKPITMTQSVLRKHMAKHGFSATTLRNLPNALNTPLMVYEWGDKAKSLIVITEIPHGDHRITAAIKLNRNGKQLEVNEIASVHGKSVERLITEMNDSRSDFAQDKLRYVDKKKALNWMSAMEAPLASSQTSSQELSLATNIIKNFEHPPLPSEENIRFREKEAPGALPTSQVSSSQEKLREELKHLRTLRKGLDSEVMQYRKRGAQNESSSTRQLKDIIARYNRSQRQIREYVNDILDAQAATTLGKREINTLLSALVRATDPQKAEEAVHRILDTVTTARLRAETARTEKLYNTKIQGETPQGVPEAKGVDDNTRVMIEYFRAHKEENINESEEALRTKEATEGLTPAEQMHMDAIYLIRLYQQATEVGNDYMAASAQMEQLEQQIDTLSKEVWHLQRAKATGGEARRKRTIEQKQQTMVQKGHLLEATRWQLQELKQNYLEQLQGFNDILQEVILNGRSAYLDWVHKQQDRQREILQGAFADAGPKAMASARQYGGWKPQGPLHKSVLAMRDFFTAPLLSLDYLIRKHTQSAPNGEGHLYNQFIRGEGGYMEASNRYFERTREITDALGEAAQRYMGISGKNMGQRWLRAQAQARRSPLTFSLQLNDGSQPQVISATQALYLRALEKQTDGQVKLRAMGISEEVMEQISQTLQQEAPEMVALADWVQEQLLPSLRESYNATHLRLFGTQMREVAHYFPISINKRETYRENDGTEHEQTLPTTTTGSIISRKPNTTAIDWNMDFFEVLDRHIQQMEHWNAYSEVVQNMNRLTSNTLFKKSLEYKNPGEARKFMDAARVAAEQYRIQVLDHESVIVKLSQAAASSKINFRGWTAIKQIASSPAFVAYSADPQFWATLSKHVATLPATLLGRGDYSWAKANLPDFRRRVQGGTAGNDALERESFSVVRKLSKDPRSPLSYGMWANAHMDAVVCAMGAKAVYEYQLSRHKRRGLSESEAQRAARRDAELSYNLSQQSALGVNLSPMQRSRNFFSVIFSTFQNAQFLYGRQLGDALRELTRSTELETEALYQRYRTQGMESAQARRAALKDVSIAKRTSVVRILTYGWGLQLLWVAMSNALPYIFGGDDDDKNLWVESAKNPAVWIGPLQGLFGGGNLTSIAEGYPFGGPMLFEDVSRFWNNYGEAAQSQGIFSWETAGVTLDLLTEFSLSQNSETFMNLYNGVQSFIDGHSTAGLLQLINAPRSQIKKILMQRGEHESLMQYAERINNLQELFRAMDRSAQGAQGTSYPLYEELEQAN